MKELRVVLMNVERDMLNILQQKTKCLDACEKHLSFIGKEKSSFLDA